MKFVVVLSLLFIGANSSDEDSIEAFMKKLQDYIEQCSEETHATDDDVAELVDHKEPTTHEGKCMIFCIQKKMNLMHEDGTIDKVGSVLILDGLRNKDFELYKKVLEIFVSCGEKAPKFDDPCETGTQLAVTCRDEAAAAGLDYRSIIA